MINLNDNSYDAKEGKAIFNNGIAGLVDNVTVSVVKKKPEEKEGSPAYKLVFTDASGAECNTPFWVVDKATAFASVDELLKKQGTIMKHILHAIYGPTFEIPTLPGDAQGFLDGCMKLIREGLQSAGKFRMFANYGTPDYPKEFIQPRSWVPFIESVTTALEETRLVAGKNDNLIRVTKDAGLGTPAAAAANLTDDWD